MHGYYKYVVSYCIENASNKTTPLSLCKLIYVAAYLWQSNRGSSPIYVRCHILRLIIDVLVGEDTEIGREMYGLDILSVPQIIFVLLRLTVLIKICLQVAMMLH